MVHRGVIYTFYSFKGGVGRSMALANVAALLAKWGRKVLVVDWDLEAPGLEKYFFGQSPALSEAQEKFGVVDLVTAYANDTPLNWESCLAKAYPLDEKNPVNILTAGNRGPDYVERLHKIDWDSLFDEKGLGLYLEQLREEWLSEFDFVLIDSRTGFTDIGGICTIHLPDFLILMFTANEQSLYGIKDVMNRARQKHQTLPFDRVRLLGVPVPSRFENTTEYELATKWKSTFAKDLAEIYADWLPDTTTPGDVLEKLFLPYVPYWSFGEGLPVVKEGTTDPRSLGFAYGLLAKLLDNRLQWDKTIAATIGTAAERSPTSINQEAESIYEDLTPRDRELARRIFGRLITVASFKDGLDDTTRRAPLIEFDDESMRVIRNLTNARLLKITNSGKAGTVEIANPALLRGWERLQEWISDDHDFLAWRQRLRARIVEWEDNEHDNSALLSGVALKKAARFLKERRGDLSQSEITYLDRSLRENKRARLKRYLVYLFVTVAVLLILTTFFYFQASQRRAAELQLRQRESAEATAKQQLELLQEQTRRQQDLLEDLRRQNDMLQNQLKAALNSRRQR